MGEDYKNTINSNCYGASSSSAIDSSNIGFQLLKKHGWKEGTGLGSSQQGRLEPVEAYVNHNKKGLGAQKLKVKTNTTTSLPINKPEKKSKKEKALSKRMRKMLDEEKRQQEKELQRAFFREFWPDNV